MNIDTSTSDGQGAARASRRDWIGLAVIFLPCLLYSVDRTVLNLATPKISADLAPTSAQLLWIVDIYGFFLAGLLVTMGTLGDRIGCRRLLLIGAAAFGAASVLAALSTSTAMLIASRALLGIAGATLAPSTLALIRHMFADPHQRAVAIGFWAASFSVGTAIGPLIGGVLLEHFSWGSVFWIGVPVMILLLVLGWLLLPEFKNPKAAQMDWVSAAQSLCAVLLVVYGFKQIAAYGWQWPAVISIAAGIAIGVAFVRRQSGLASPLIDLQLLRTPSFTAALLTFSVGCFVLSGIALFSALYLQQVLGFSPLHSGLWTLPGPIGLITGYMAAPVIARRVAPAPTMIGGSLLAVVGLAMIAHANSVSGAASLASGLFVYSLGMGPALVTAVNLMVSSVKPECAGEASAISETGGELGAALGVAILGSVAGAIYHGEMAAALPRDLAPELALAARDTLAGALTVAQQLPEQARAPLLDVARGAFGNSLQMVAVASACMIVVVAITVAVLAWAQPSATLNGRRKTRFSTT